MVDALQPREGAFTVFDSEVSGFGVRVSPTGRKVFVLKYTKRAVQRWVTLGPYGELTLDQARKMAAKMRLEVLEAGRALAPARAHLDSVMVRDLGARFLAEHADVKTKSRTAVEYRRVVEKLINPVLGHHLVVDVTPSDTHALHHKLEKTPRQANLVLAVLSKMFNLAELWGYRPQQTNPCYHIERYREAKRERYLSPKELEAMGSTFRKLEESKAEDPYVIAAFRMLIFTGARLNEILQLKWSQVDLENGLLKLSDSKTGAKVILLSTPAQHVLEDLRPFKENPFVFPGDREGKSWVNLEKPWRRIRTLAGLEGVRIHDLRHTFASVGVQSGLSLESIGGLLGHSQSSTTKRYAHLSQGVLKTQNDKVGKHLSKALDRDSTTTVKAPIKRASKKS